MKYNINKVLNYLSEFTGGQIKTSTTSKAQTSRLPLAISGCYGFRDIEILGTTLTMVIPEIPEDCTPMQLAKHQTKIQETFDRPIAFILDTIESYNITRMTRSKVNFIVPGKIIFIPNLMMILRDIKKSTTEMSEQMTPVAQLLVLYHIQVERLNGMDTSGIAEITSMAYPTINVALKWLKGKGFVELIGGKQKKVQFVINGKELWDKALPLMSSPVERTLYASNDITNAFLAGESAMGYYTMLAEPANPAYAISKATVKSNADRLNNQFGEIKVEVWKYNPALLARNGVVDNLSLYLCMKDIDDERIQMECDTLIENTQW